MMRWTPPTASVCRDGGVFDNHLGRRPWRGHDDWAGYRKAGFSLARGGFAWAQFDRAIRSCPFERGGRCVRLQPNLLQRMHPKLLTFAERVRSSYWFVPAIMAVLALLLGAGVIYLDAAIGSDWLNGLSWYQSNKPDGARVAEMVLEDAA